MAGSGQGPGTREQRGRWQRWISAAWQFCLAIGESVQEAIRADGGLAAATREGANAYFGHLAGVGQPRRIAAAQACLLDALAKLADIHNRNPDELAGRAVELLRRELETEERSPIRRALRKWRDCMVEEVPAVTGRQLNEEDIEDATGGKLNGDSL